MQVVDLRGNAPSFFRADEPAVHHAACEPGAAGLHAADRPGEQLAPERAPYLRAHLSGRSRRHTWTLAPGFLLSLFYKDTRVVILSEARASARSEGLP